MSGHQFASMMSGNFRKSLEMRNRGYTRDSSDRGEFPGNDSIAFISEELIFKMSINRGFRATVNLRWHVEPLTARRRSLYRVHVNYANE